MKTFLCLLLTLLPFSANATLNLFACEPEWAALGKEIGGDLVDTFSATTAKEDPHHIRARPSLISKARSADILVCSGAGLEVGWLPILLQKGSSNIQPGSKGHLIAANVVKIIEIPTKVDRSMGDIHPEGNPHLHLNPHNIALVAAELTNRLKEIDPANASIYGQRYDDFIKRWKNAINTWEQQAASLAGKNIIVHHRSFSYLLDWLNINTLASLEPKPGLPPTTSHLETLLDQTRNQNVAAIIRGAYEPEDASNWLSEKTSIPAVMLPYTIGGDEYSKDLFTLFDRTIALLLESAA